MKQLTHFIEVVKHYDGRTESTSPQSIRLFSWALQTTKKIGMETIAIFKIYPK